MLLRPVQSGNSDAPFTLHLARQRRSLIWDVKSLDHAMLTRDQQKTVLLAPCLPLSFLVRPERRAKKPTGMESFSESACFHRLHDLFWTLRDADAAALLSTDERAALAEFTRVLESLPWRVIEAHPHISELPDDDLSPLVPGGERLLWMLEARTARSRRFEWLRHLFGLFRVSHARATSQNRSSPIVPP